MAEIPRAICTRESLNRSLIKATTYRVIITILNFVMVLVLTGNFDIAAGFTVVSVVYTSAAYIVHERIWARVSWGLIEPQ